MPNILDTVQISGSSYDLKDKNAPSVSAVTQQEYDNLPSSAKTSNTFFVITDATAGDLTQYWTSAQTQSAITQATSGKVDTSSVVTAVTSGSTDNEIPTAKAVYDATQSGGGGGTTYTAGRGIDITNDTISFSLPISAGTGADSVIIGRVGTSDWTSKAMGKGTIAGGSSSSAITDGSFAFGYLSKAGYGSKLYAFSHGYNTNAKGYASHAEGKNTTSNGDYSHAEGNGTIANNQTEHASGQYNVSSSASTTWGDSGNTLFSVGNGTADNARHNAFEIRQNGDIYLNDGTNDVKLQDTIIATRANTTALGGLSLVKLTQAEYDALATKDSNVLYVIVG